MRTTRAVVVGVGLLLAAAPVWAHHAFSAEFDVKKPMKLQGTLTRLLGELPEVGQMGVSVTLLLPDEAEG